jgi:hypothetical protein
MKHSYHVVLRKWCFYIAIVALNSTANEVFASSICHYYIGYDLSTATIVCTSGEEENGPDRRSRPKAVP